MITVAQLAELAKEAQLNDPIDWGELPLEEQATLLSQKDLTSKDEQLINILCDANVPPSKITKIMSSIREDDKGTLLPKTIFNINEKCRRLIGMSIRIY